MPPIRAIPPAASTKLRRPNLSETRPVIRRLMALHKVHTIEKRLASELGPALGHQLCQLEDLAQNGQATLSFPSALAGMGFQQTEPAVSRLYVPMSMLI